MLFQSWILSTLSAGSLLIGDTFAFNPLRYFEIRINKREAKVVEETQRQNAGFNTKLFSSSSLRFYNDKTARMCYFGAILLVTN
jgi:hypothetical protein